MIGFDDIVQKRCLSMHRFLRTFALGFKSVLMTPASPIHQTVQRLAKEAFRRFGVACR